MNYLGLPLLAWLGVVWIALAGTFLVLLLYRVLIRVHEEDAVFLRPGEMLLAQRHLREIDSILKGLGYASAGLAAAIAAAWAFGLPLF